MLRLLKRLFWLTLLGGIVWGGIFLSSAAFAQKWRRFVIDEMAGRGVYMQFTRLTIDPFRGLVARDVQVFNDEHRTQLIAGVERMNLDFDLGRILRGEVAVEAMELADTKLSLPVDPQQPSLTVVSLTDVNARVFLIDDRLDIRRAEADLAGIHLSVTGSLLLSPHEADDEEQKKKREEDTARRLKFIRDNREQIQKSLQWLTRFQFAQRPQLHIDVNGAVKKFEEMDARLTFSARGLSYESYVCQEVEAQAEYQAGFFDLTRLYLKDRLGILDASGGWQMGGNEVSFRLSTSADLHGLASTFLESDLLREAVFYEPPNLSMDGKWYVGGPKSKSTRPLNVLGKMQCGRFNSRGEVFEGLAGNFGIDSAGWYLRDGLLRHKSGTLGFQAMLHDIKGLKYSALLKMDPTVFMPFLPAEGARDAVERFGFNEKSSVFVRIEGGADAGQLNKAKTTGHAELRGFTYRGVEFDSADGDLEIAGPVQTFRNITARRKDETINAAEVVVDNTDHWVGLKGVTGRLNPVIMTGCFAPQVANYISRYRLSNQTQVAVSGTVGWRGHAFNNLKAVFHDADGTGIYSLLGREYKIAGPAGEVSYTKSILDFDVKGQLFGSPMTTKGKVNLAPGVTDYTVSLKAGRFPYPVVGKDLPFANLNAGIVGTKNKVAYDISAKVFSGAMTLAGTMDPREQGGFQGELRVDAASFRQFAQTYSPAYETEGDLTGHFRFEGKGRDWQKLKGNGVAIIVNGNLYAIPIIGPLTSLISAVIPAPIKGYNVAKEANCTFKVADGFIVTDNFEALTSAFRIVTKGDVDFIKDDIDFEAQVRVRGITGIVLRPVSELLEYHGEGTVGKPQWHLNPFGIGGGKKERNGRKPPAAEDEPASPVANKDDKTQNGGSTEAAKEMPKEKVKDKEKSNSLPSKLKRILPFGIGNGGK